MHEPDSDLGLFKQAVVQGMWVVFEDIDRAPFEILSALVPLLEDRKLYIAGRGEVCGDDCHFLQIYSEPLGERPRLRNWETYGICNIWHGSGFPV